MFKNDAETVKKSDLTRQRVYDVAMSMFAKKGFDATTMRAIAEKAEVAPGAIYYYFESKESIAHEYYQQLQNDHQKSLQGILEKETQFGKRLHFVVTSKMQVANPYKDMARALFRVAANPESPISPFSAESKKVRLEALEIFASVVEGSDFSFHPEIKKILPQFLWLYQMGIILYWIYDNSKESAKTFELIDKTVPLIETLNQTIQNPLAAPFRKKIISILKSFTPELG